MLESTQDGISGGVRVGLVGRAELRIDSILHIGCRDICARGVRSGGSGFGGDELPTFLQHLATRRERESREDVVQSRLAVIQIGVMTKARECPEEPRGNSLRARVPRAAG